MGSRAHRPTCHPTQPCFSVPFLRSVPCREIVVAYNLPVESSTTDPYERPFGDATPVLCAHGTPRIADPRALVNPHHSSRSGEGGEMEPREVF